MHTRIERDRKRVRGWFTEGGCGAWWRNTTDDEAAPTPTCDERGRGPGRRKWTKHETNENRNECNRKEARWCTCAERRRGERRKGTSACNQRTGTTNTGHQRPHQTTNGPNGLHINEPRSQETNASSAVLQETRFAGRCDGTDRVKRFRDRSTSGRTHGSRWLIWLMMQMAIGVHGEAGDDRVVHVVVMRVAHSAAANGWTWRRRRGQIGRGHRGLTALRTDRSQHRRYRR